MRARRPGSRKASTCSPRPRPPARGAAGAFRRLHFGDRELQRRSVRTRLALRRSRPPRAAVHDPQAVRRQAAGLRRQGAARAHPWRPGAGGHETAAGGALPRPIGPHIIAGYDAVRARKVGLKAVAGPFRSLTESRSRHYNPGQMRRRASAASLISEITRPAAQDHAPRTYGTEGSMANTKSAKKKTRVIARRTKINQHRRSMMRGTCPQGRGSDRRRRPQCGIGGAPCRRAADHARQPEGHRSQEDGEPQGVASDTPDRQDRAGRSVTYDRFPVANVFQNPARAGFFVCRLANSRRLISLLRRQRNCRNPDHAGLNFGHEKHRKHNGLHTKRRGGFQFHLRQTYGGLCFIGVRGSVSSLRAGA